MPSNEIDEKNGDQSLQPLLRWAEPLFAPARERALRRWSKAARHCPQYFDGERLERSIREAFAGPALNWSYRALLLELAIARHQQTLQGETPQQRFAFFLDWLDGADGRAVIDARYPLLREDIIRLAAQTEAFLDHFLDRLTRDFTRLPALLATPPGRLQAFVLGQGDRHDHGGSVVELRFEYARALYKPRSLAMDMAFAGLVAELGARDVAPLQLATTSLDCGDYGYAAWVDYAPVADAAAVTRYYARYGGLVGLAYLLNCNDLHLENLIAHGEYPVLIDLETVFQPWISRYPRNKRTGVPYVPSILSSGLLPGQIAVETMDMSGLAWQEHRYQVRLARNAGTDQLRLALGETTVGQSLNVPHYADGRRVPSHDFVEAIVQGFEAMYRGLCRIKPALRGRQGLLAPFTQVETRTVLRSTQIYARLLDAMAHPQYLRSTAEREAVVARLEVGGRNWPALRRTQPAEREALLHGDVPRFLANVDGIDIHDSDGHVIARLCERSGWSEVQRRVRDLSLGDLHRQRYALRQSLECGRLASEPKGAGPRATARNATVQPYRGRSFLDTAIALGDDLLQLSFRGNGGIIFFQPEYRDGDKPAVSLMSLSVYEGLLGVLLVLAELGLHSGLDRFIEAAEAALTTCRRALQDDPKALLSIGPYSGLSGWLYVLLMLGRRWQRDDLLDEAVAWLPQVAERIHADESLDLIGGAAGCLLVLLELQRHRPGEAVLTAAAACAARLREQAQHDDNGACWISPAAEGKALTGFSHGTAGIVAALLRYGRQAGDESSLALAAEALRHERAAFVARGRRWYDRYASPADGEPGRDIVSWCHGASGVGLARLLWPQSLRDAEWRTELESCIASVREQTAEASQTLCHGQLGDLDLLLQVAVCEGDAAALADCHERGKAVLEMARSGWIFGGTSLAQEPLGLMTGLTSIAYGCLRLHDPATTPAVLSLATEGLPTPIA